MAHDPSQEGGPSRWRGPLREMLKYGLLLALGALLLVFLLRKINLDRLIIDQVVWWLLGPICLLTLLSFAARAWFFANALPGDGVPARGQFLLTSVYSWLAIVFPLGLGHLSYPYLLKRHYAVPAARGASAVLSYNLLRVLALCGIFGLALAGLSAGKGLRGLTPWVVALAMAGLLLAAGLVLTRHGRRPNLPGRLGALLGAVLDGSAAILASPRLGRLVIAALIAEGLNLAVYLCAFRMTGLPVGPAAAALVFGLANLSILLPIHSLGSAGTFEAIVAFALIATGLDPSDAIQASILVHGTQLVTRSAIGLICYLLFRCLR